MNLFNLISFWWNASSFNCRQSLLMQMYGYNKCKPTSMLLFKHLPVSWVQFSYHQHTKQFSCQTTPMTRRSHLAWGTLHLTHQGYGTQTSLIELGKKCCCTISPWWVIYNFRPTERACLLSVEPRSNTRFAEDVTTMEENWSLIFIVADWALTASCL